MTELTPERRPRKSLRLLTVVIVAAVLVGGGAVIAFAPRLTAELKTRTVCVDFVDAVGVYQGNAVSMMGLQVGKIDKIEPRTGGVRMTLSVRQDLQLAADVGAVVIDSSIVADRRVEFSGPYRGGATLSPGSCISVDRTKTPRGVSQAYQALDNLLADVLGPDGELRADAAGTDLARLLDMADRNFAGRGPQLVQVLRNFVRLQGNPTQTDAALRGILDNSNTLAKGTVEHWPEIEKLVRTVNDAGIAFVGFSEEFAEGLKSAIVLVPVLGRITGRFGDRILSIVEFVTPWVQVLAPFATRIAQLVAQLPGLASVTDQIFDKRTGALRVTWAPPAVSIKRSDLSALCSLLNKPAGCAKQDAAKSGLIQMILGGDR
ncbi:MlaD family protein [Gordonia sp. CPCC 205333]|uniref:MlaD family protein n=1 Tax=Gordonia sp. CPCC 205333 TaxID=3140790 RepID=UPI003AF3B255